VTNYEPINLTLKPGLTTFYQYMSELSKNHFCRTPPNLE